MTKDILYTQKFKCKCKIESEFLTWISEINTHTCDKCKKQFIPVYKEIDDSAPNYIIASKHKNGRGKAVSDKRRIDHFKKEIMPTLDPTDQLAFRKQFNKKK